MTDEFFLTRKVGKNCESLKMSFLGSFCAMKICIKLVPGHSLPMTLIPHYVT